MSEETSEALPKWLPWATVGASALGLADSIYLTIEHYTARATLACPDTGIINCAKVTSSQYSQLLGIPLPVLGLAFFAVAIAITSPWAWRITVRWFVWARLVFAASGVPFVLWLIYVELFKLDAICLYCTGIHILTIALFALTAYGSELLLAREE